jgi:glycosyltransferase involved in cell wall biosynthesis
MSDSPVLIIAFNRPHKLRQLIASLRSSRPPILMIAVDGPRSHNKSDETLVRETQAVVSEIDWPCKIHTRFRESNLGLQTAYVDAVNWAMSEFGETIVIEDDVIAGPELYGYLNFNLNQFRNNQIIGQINGYNFAPVHSLTEPNRASRVTRYPTSYCWASWSRSWELIDLSIGWGLSVSITDLSAITGSRLSATMWRMNFRNAVSRRVDSWAYAWVATLWENDLKIISPNRNLCLYDGFEGGTHTRRRVTTRQLEIESVDDSEKKFNLDFDGKADLWQKQFVYRETPSGFIEKGAASLVLEMEKRLRRRRSKK